MERDVITRINEREYVKVLKKNGFLLKSILEASLWFPWQRPCLRERQLEEEEEEAQSEETGLRRKEGNGWNRAKWGVIRGYNWSKFLKIFEFDLTTQERAKRWGDQRVENRFSLTQMKREICTAIYRRGAAKSARFALFARRNKRGDAYVVSYRTKLLYPQGQVAGKESSNTQFDKDVGKISERESF